MSMYVRHLRITGLNTTGETLDETDVERIIVNVAQLEYFRYRPLRCVLSSVLCDTYTHLKVQSPDISAVGTPASRFLSVSYPN